MVVSPRYQNGTPADDKFASAVDLDCPIKIHCFGGVQDVGFFHEYRDGVDWVRNLGGFIHLPSGCFNNIYTLKTKVRCSDLGQ